MLILISEFDELSLETFYDGLESLFHVIFVFIET